jgi:hypothetical protein
MFKVLHREKGYCEGMLADRSDDLVEREGLYARARGKHRFWLELRIWLEYYLAKLEVEVKGRGGGHVFMFFTKNYHISFLSYLKYWSD